MRFVIRVEESMRARLEERALRQGRLRGLPDHLKTGLRGERAALRHLRLNGYQVTAHRWSAAEVRGDLDIVAWKDDVVAFVEVKTRTAHDQYSAAHAVDHDKRRTLRRLARRYLRSLGRHVPAGKPRFDIVEVYLEKDKPAECIHSTGVFGWEEPHGDRWQ